MDATIRHGNTAHMARLPRFDFAGIPQMATIANATNVVTAKAAQQAALYAEC